MLFNWGSLSQVVASSYDQPFAIWPYTHGFNDFMTVLRFNENKTCLSPQLYCEGIVMVEVTLERYDSHWFYQCKFIFLQICIKYGMFRFG